MAGIRRNPYLVSPKLPNLAILLAVLLTFTQISYALPPLPGCAFNCYNSATAGQLGCSGENLHAQCLCHPPASDKILTCVKGDCDDAGLQKWLAYVRGNCLLYGVTLGTSGSLSYGAGESGGRSKVTSSAGMGALASVTKLATTTVTLNGMAITATVPATGGDAVPTSGGSSSNTQSPASAQSSLKNDDTSGLSTGAKIGIGAGIGAAALLALAALLWRFLRWHRRRRATQPKPPFVASNSLHAKGDDEGDNIHRETVYPKDKLVQEVDGTSSPLPPSHHELGDQQRHELSTGAATPWNQHHPLTPHELSSLQPHPHELGEGMYQQQRWR